MKNEPSVWTMEEAVTLIRTIAPMLERVGWTIGLAGSVLEHVDGKDLRLILSPSHVVTVQTVKRVLIECGFRWLTPQRRHLEEEWEAGLTHSERWAISNKPVELFFLR